MWRDHRGLGLLLVVSSGACLGLPRFPADGGDSDDDDQGTTAEPAPTVTPSAPAPNPVTTTPPPPATSSSPGTTSTTSPATVTTAAPPPDFGLPPIPDVGSSNYELCLAYADSSEECQGGYYENAYEFCVEYRMELMSSTPDCVPFFDEFLACLSELDCEQLEMGFEDCEFWLNELFECTG